jgi:hypothetical protein
MNIKELKLAVHSFIESEGLSDTDVWIGAGTTLLLFGIRTTTDDIDMATSDEGLWLKVKANNPEAPLSEFTIKGNTAKIIELIVEGQKLDFHLGLPELEEDLVMYEGINTYTLQRVLRMKEELNRPKDQKDIKAIKKVLASKKKYLNW